MKEKCLICYQPLETGEKNYHGHCSKRFFGTDSAPELPFGRKDLDALAQKAIQNSISVPGVQAKLSLKLSHKDQTGIKKFTIIGAIGDYILKPPSEYYPALPELEDLTMHMASFAKIAVVPHCLISFDAGELAYLTKRIDRHKKDKLHMEDMCQLSERLTEHKYRGSYEQIGKIILKHSSTPGLDLIIFLEQLVFCFLTGNADMHLKNFSLLKSPGQGYRLSPAYDMLATALVTQNDDEDLALTLNGKKKKIKRQDFTAAFNTLQVEPQQQNNIFKKMNRARAGWENLVQQSFLDSSLKQAYIALLDERFARLGFNPAENL